MRRSWIPAVSGAVALVLGAGSMAALLISKKTPAEASAETEEKAIRVELLEAVPTRVPVTLRGHGEMRPIRVAQIAPEVAGRVVSVHPDFEVGRSVPAAAVLFTVDPTLYARQVAEAEAAVAQAGAALRRIEADAVHARQRVSTLERRVSLAWAQLDRAEQLVARGIGAETERESAEQNHIAARQERDQAAHTAELAPIHLEEARRDLDLAQSRLETAQHNLSLTEVRAPFAGRIKSRSVETGQYVRPGEAAVTLADDSVLELPVQLDAREASAWLRFAGPRDNENWFGNLEAVPCRVAWTESHEPTMHEGTLDRIENFDPESRMLTVVIRVAPAASTTFPLVEGMFCRAEIPGRDLDGVFQLPKTAVTFDNTVYLSVENRLKTVAVTLARIDDHHAYVAEGIAAGDQVVTTRLVNPLDHSLLETVETAGEPS